MTAVSVCLSVCHAAQLGGGACSVRGVSLFGSQSGLLQFVGCHPAASLSVQLTLYNENGIASRKVV